MTRVFGLLCVGKNVCEREARRAGNASRVWGTQERKGLGRRRVGEQVTRRAADRTDRLGVRDDGAGRERGLQQGDDGAICGEAQDGAIRRTPRN
jgi:hypothetical protein